MHAYLYYYYTPTLYYHCNLMDVQTRKGNIFTLLEDEEKEEQKPSKTKQTKNQAPPVTVKAEPKASKPKTEKKKLEPIPDPPVKPKEERNKKKVEKPERDDRKSKTGRGREMKKGGGGGHNWGKPEYDAKQEDHSWNLDDAKDTEPKQDENTEAKDEEVQEKSPDFITFDDYLKSQAKYTEEQEKDKEADVEAEEEPEKKGFLGFKIQVGDRRRGGQRGRGQGRTRAGQTREQEHRNAPNPMDLASFPSLG